MAPGFPGPDFERGGLVGGEEDGAEEEGFGALGYEVQGRGMLFGGGGGGGVVEGWWEVVGIWRGGRGGGGRVWHRGEGGTRVWDEYCGRCG